MGRAQFGGANSMFDNIVELKSITKKYPGITALSNLNLFIRKGSIHGLVGPNGAGKTTTMKILTGLIPPTSGEVKLNYKSVGLLSELPPLYQMMKVRAYLKFVGEIYGVSKKEIDQRVIDISELCGVSKNLDRLIKNLSKGNKQKVGIAAALVHSPELIVLDEPVVGLDPSAIQEIRELLIGLKERHTIIISSHLLHEIQKCCDYVTFIKDGQSIKSLSIDEIVTSSIDVPTQVIDIEVLEWNQKIENELKNKFKIKSIQTLRKSDSHLITIEIEKGKKDIRAEISSFIYANGASLIGMNVKQHGLEEKFNEINKGGLNI